MRGTHFADIGRLSAMAHLNRQLMWLDADQALNIRVATELLQDGIVTPE